MGRHGGRCGREGRQARGAEGSAGRTADPLLDGAPRRAGRHVRAVAASCPAVVLFGEARPEHTIVVRDQPLLAGKLLTNSPGLKGLPRTVLVYPLCDSCLTAQLKLFPLKNKFS